MENNNKSLDLSVIIISKDEENNIGKCIESILKEIRTVNSEIILVDSASKDKTVEIAKKYKIKIIILEDTKPLCPSIGRYTGTKYSKGKYLFFIDGDMILHKGWIKAALKKLENEKIGGLCGLLLWIDQNGKLDANRTDKRCGYLRSLGGTAIYRRDVLEKSGTFNPFLRGEEERELGYRIRKNNYILEKINHPIAYHIGKKQSLSEIHEKAKYFIGVGQILRKYKFSKISFDLIKDHKRTFFQQIFIFLLAIFIFLMLFLGMFLPIVILFLILLILGKINGLKKTYLFLTLQILILSNIIRGIFIGIKDSTQYTHKLTII